MKRRAFLGAAVSLAGCSRLTVPPPVRPLSPTPEEPFRLKPPAPTPAAPLQPPPVEAVALENGLVVYLLPRPESPDARVRFVRRRNFESPREYELAMAAAQFVSHRRFHDRREPFETGFPDVSSLSMTVARGELGGALDTLSPGKFTSADAAAFRGMLERQARTLPMTPFAKSLALAMRDLYGPEYPQAATPHERRQRLEGFTDEDFEGALRDQLSLAGSGLIVVGGTRDEVLGIVRERLGKAHSSTPARREKSWPCIRKPGAIVHLARAATASEQVTIATIPPPPRSPAEAAFNLATRCLLEGSSSVLAKALRGQTRSSIPWARDLQTCAAFVPIAPEAAAAALEAIEKTLRDFAAYGPDEADLERARASELESLSSALEDDASLSLAIGNLHWQGRSLEYWKQRDAELRQVSRSDVMDAARVRWDPSSVSICVTGYVADLASELQWTKVKYDFVDVD
jgi:predicted Zn-dependent peptidase